MTDTRELIAAVATRRGTREHNMDAAGMFESCRGPLAIAVVDGIGNDCHGARAMQLVADAAVRIGVTRGPLAGVLTAAALIDDPGVEDYSPDGVLVLAVADPDNGSTELAWVGDSHIYGWDGSALNRRSDPHTMGVFLRQNGDVDLAPKHDNWIRITLSTATPTTVALSEAAPGELIILVSDGLDDVPQNELADLVTEHQRDPQALADALVAAGREDENGYRDDVTAAVLTRVETGQRMAE